MSSFLTAHQHIIGYFSALQWCEYCDKIVEISSRLFSYDKNGVTRRRIENKNGEWGWVDEIPESWLQGQPKIQTVVYFFRGFAARGGRSNKFPDTNFRGRHSPPVSEDGNSNYTKFWENMEPSPRLSYSVYYVSSTCFVLTLKC